RYKDEQAAESRRHQLQAAIIAASWRPFARTSESERKQYAHLAHPLPAVLGIQVLRPRLQQILERDHADKRSRFAFDDGETRQPGFRHAMHDDAERLVRVRDRRRRMDAVDQPRPW